MLLVRRMAAGVGGMTADARADARGRAAHERERTGGAALERRPAVVGHHGRPLRARTSLSLRGRLWTLAYVYGTVFARLGGVRADVGRCGGGVGGVGGASAMHVCDAFAVCSKCLYVCLYVVKIALHLIFARLKVCTFDIYSIPILISFS